MVWIKFNIAISKQGLSRIQAAIGTQEEEQILKKEFFSFPSISIDYGIMEKAQDIYTCNLTRIL